MQLTPIQPVRAYDALRAAEAKIIFTHSVLEKAVEQGELAMIKVLLIESSMTIREAYKAFTCFSREATEMFLRGDIYTYPEEEGDE